MRPKTDMTERFVQKAKAVAATVVHVKSKAEAFDHAVAVCNAKQACQLLVPGCEESLSQKAGALCETKQQKVMAAPDLSPEEFKALENLCREKSILLIKDGLRNHLAGIDIGFTMLITASPKPGPWLSVPRANPCDWLP